ncbi:hypothetical protein B9T38_05775 [Acinetobacter sp. ANC 4218]|uniref:hypothetical protein n=1 Tax=Acinetobacter sp. ANC 4218 TaxID=1977880 RepID=UPI000A34D724|nr:hypothetical protein [Acinetobacter sp. ANC 4218]OTG73121.1 hypothetical protein B9T38_05775 [Acinetobacter sp. ANC 4218]
MGWLDFGSTIVSNVASAIGGFLGSSTSSNGDSGGRSYSNSGSSTVTNYDPDKIRVAELENERVHLVKEAQLEIIQANAKIEAVMLEAKFRGFQAIADSLARMQKELDQLANSRLELIERSSLEQVKEIEAFYGELAKSINEDDKFFTIKLPQLLETSNQFPENSDSKKIYMDAIALEIKRSIDFKSEQLSNLGFRQKAVVDANLQSKLAMSEHANNLSLGIKQNIQNQVNMIESKISDKRDLNSVNQLKLD